MGQVDSRKLIRVDKIETFGSLPQGRYLKAVYQTEFQLYPDSQEIVVLAEIQGQGYGVAGYKVEYDRWPEAIKIIGNGLFIVFFIMCLLAFLTWFVGKVMQKREASKQAAGEKG